MHTPPEETVGIDIFDAYRCDHLFGVPAPWERGRLFQHQTDLFIPEGGRADIQRIGLLLASPESDFLTTIISDVSLKFLINMKVYWEKSLSAFHDMAMLKQEELRLANTVGAQGDLLVGVDSAATWPEVPVLSCSLPVEPQLLLRARQDWSVLFEMPEALAKEIRLKEREVFAYLANNSRPRPAWFLRMGARIIGTKTRSIL